MHRLLLTAVATAIVATTALIPSRAGAIPLSGLADIPMALEGINPIEKVAVCFYFDGWRGPGLYQCGYRLRVNEGWVGERREREERRERFDDRRERRERFEDRREGRERFEANAGIATDLERTPGAARFASNASTKSHPKRKPGLTAGLFVDAQSITAHRRN